ncbi:hypothetical protein [Paraflavitalea sp. CAU 1676]|uniref:hypothetical protein n=1 Tax=Paraflavitalea sp. CAU 1676 TaxID=3032598 RepID=UPI0023DB68D3|nr:hypothetical protein [Paraflavitalea sp. CAU 1676]MDF2189837.1 hypothetical protein [Paraflavitalea sp. CAU 1676]
MADNKTNVEALTTILSVLKDLDVEAQRRTIQAVITFLDIPSLPKALTTIDNQATEISKNEVSFSENRSISPKNFIRDKAPKTDIERIACLAYYLTHYRDTPQFKTIDLSSLNTEAAQPKLSNAAYAVDNATKAGLLAQALKGAKQLSAAGEYFVQALPDRDAAKATLTNMRPKRRSKKSITKKNGE